MLDVTDFRRFRREARERHLQILKAERDKAFAKFVEAVRQQVKTDDAANTAHVEYIELCMKVNKLEEQCFHD